MFYRITWFIVTVFLVVPVIGLIMMWLRKSWSQAVRVALTILFCFYAVVIVVFLLPSDDRSSHEQPNQAENEQAKQDTERDGPKDEQENTDEAQDRQQDRAPSDVADDPKEQIQQELDNTSAAKLLSIQGTFDQEPYDMELVLRGAQGASKSESVKNMKTGILKAVYAVKDAGYDINALDINVKYPVTNKNGLDEEQFAIKSHFSGTTIDDMAENRTDADLTDLDAIADSWWKHPVLDE